MAAWEEEAALTRRTGEQTLLPVLLLLRAAGIPSVEGTPGNTVAASGLERAICTGRARVSHRK